MNSWYLQLFEHYSGMMLSCIALGYADAAASYARYTATYARLARLTTKDI